MGLMIGIEVTEEASNIQKVALDNGLLVLTAGPNVLRMLPPLIISNEELENGLSILLQAIESV
jgi:acetylornithine/N-succinyldiaminopimelate aminotransferase